MATILNKEELDALEYLQSIAELEDYDFENDDGVTKETIEILCEVGMCMTEDDDYYIEVREALDDYI